MVCTHRMSLEATTTEAKVPPAPFPGCTAELYGCPGAQHLLAWGPGPSLPSPMQQLELSVALRGRGETGTLLQLMAERPCLAATLDPSMVSSCGELLKCC